jgi:hypothetical protein
MTRVADLAGGLLDYWAGRADGISAEQLRLSPVANSDVVLCVQLFKWGEPDRYSYQPSQSWTQGGPLIEKHRIELGAPTESGTFAGIWTANTEWGHVNGWQGPTPLIAAMRALVASVYGDSVPDEVQS